jgi:2-dehydropantoate 2-reductase
MKICVIGAGAIGGLVGGRMALAGEDVTLVDIGAHLDAIRRNGLKIIAPDGAETVVKNAKATDNLASAGPQDMVILALKTQHIAGVAANLQAVLGAETVIVPVQNGLPWWYFQRHGGSYEGRRLESCDPTGAIGAHIPPERIIGCVVYPAGEIKAPGVVRHVEGDRFPVGELDGKTTPRVQKVSEAFVKAGFKSPVLDNIRAEIWLKLWGNMSFNPISALTHATLVDICQYPLTRDLAAQMMTEAQQIANALGVEFRVPLEKRIAGAEKVGKHKTSTLQDVEHGRGLELDTIVGGVIELGKLTHIPTPHVETVFALTKLLDKTLQDEKGRLRIEKGA